MTTWITICDTCKREGWETGDMAQTDGEILAALIEKRAENSSVKTRRVSCLMGCTHGCNVAIQAPGKLAYTVGKFEPESEAADAVVTYAELHAESASGQVPYRQWPQAIKGHFITRHQPLPEDQ
jgi:predicted metal-binding protein